MVILWLLFAYCQALIFNDPTNLTNLSDYGELQNVSCKFGPYGNFITEDKKANVWLCKTLLSDKYNIIYSKIEGIDVFHVLEWKSTFKIRFVYGLELNQKYLQSRNQSCLMGFQEIHFMSEYSYFDDEGPMKLSGIVMMLFV